MKNNSSSRAARLLPLFALLLIYLMFCAQSIIRPVANSEASNYLNFFQLSTTGEPISSSRHSLFTQDLYFATLSPWTNFFGSSLTSIRSFSVFCGAFIIFILFFILRSKLSTKRTLPLISIFVLNPLFIHLATSFDSHIVLLLVLFVLYAGLYLLYNIKLKDLISFRKRRPLINWRAVFPSVSSRSRAQTIFSLFSFLAAIALIISTLLIGLKQDTTLRKTFIAIYQSKIVENPVQNNSQLSQQNIPIIVDQQYSSSLVVENILVAKDLKKEPFSIHWGFSIGSIKKQLKDQQGFWLLSSQNQSSSSLKEQLSNYQEIDFINFDHYLARYFVTQK